MANLEQDQLPVLNKDEGYVDKLLQRYLLQPVEDDIDFAEYLPKETSRNIHFLWGKISGDLFEGSSFTSIAHYYCI